MFCKKNLFINLANATNTSDYLAEELSSKLKHFLEILNFILVEVNDTFGVSVYSFMKLVLSSK